LGRGLPNTATIFMVTLLDISRSKVGADLRLITLSYGGDNSNRTGGKGARGKRE
jgi:hypothetical protein